MEYQTPPFFRVMRYVDQADHDVIDMVSGNPDWGAPAALANGLHAYAELGGDDFQYSPSEGLPVLREAIARQRSVDTQQVVITNGACEANYLAIAGALERNRGREVIMVDPAYPYYPNKTKMLGGTPRTVAVDDTGQLDSDQIRAAATDDTAGILINSPNNPTGAVYPEATIRDLIDVAEEHDAILIGDETYDEFDFSGEFTSVLSYESDNRFLTNSFSKALAITGFRVGYGIYPQPHVPRAKSRHMLTNIAASRPAQYAVLSALRNTTEEYFQKNRDLLRDRVARFLSALSAIGAQYTRPQGAFYVMARFDGFPGTFENVERLIDEAGVAGMPGEAFGSSKARWIRFALVSPRVDEATDRLETYFQAI